MGSLLQDLLVDGKLRVNGVTQSERADIVTVSGSSYTVTTEDFGKMLSFTYAGAVAVTLPANTSATLGAQFWCVNYTSDTVAPTYSAATADTLITFNDAAADSITFGSGHRIGSLVWFFGTGSAWVGVVLSVGHTVTIATN
jgi:hypothetical protein